MAQFAFFEQEVATSAYDKLMLEGELGHAITHDEFALVFQPQVRARDGHPVGVEALIRWQHPQRGLLAPNEFIALAEQHRLIVPIGAWVLREAARQARLWHEAGWPLTVAVNLSTLQFQAPDFVASIRTLLAETGLPAGWLELELTERMLMDDVPQVCARLQQLRALGVKLSVDDFGTGYSSLSHLKELPIDTMKIDRSFVQELPHQRESAAITSAIIQLARGLGLDVVAEGVETEAQRAFLIAQGCDQLQGLIISAPLTVQQMQRWLDAQPAPRPNQPP
jgi:EAL domain-containing protein (putative c-di-GMP-specific phosphodiesterase class I)